MRFRFDVTNEHLRLHPGRFVRANLDLAHPVNAGAGDLKLLAVPVEVLTERGNLMENGPNEAFLVVPSGAPAAHDVAGIERRIALLTNRHDLHRGLAGEHLHVWMPVTIVQDLMARAA